MAKITRATILTAAAAVLGSKPPQEPISVPQLAPDGDLYVRGMSAKERDQFEESLRIRKGVRKGETSLLNFRARLAVLCLVDEDGDRVLEDSDAEVLGALPAGVLDRILVVINRLSGRGEEEVEELGNASASPAASDALPSNSH